MDVCSFTYPGSLSRRRPPANFLPGDEECFIHEFVKCFPPMKAISLEDVIVSSNGLCITGNSRLPRPVLLLPDKTTPIRQWLKSGVMVARQTLRGVPTAQCEQVHKALLLTDVYFDGFFHWFGDILPKLEALVQRRADLSDHAILIPASRYAAYVTESLAAYGLECRVIPSGSAVRVEKLCFIPRLAPTGNYRTELMLGVRARMRERYASSEGGIRLFVSRKQAVKRRLLNEAALEEILARYGFHSVCMEDLSFPEQAGLASRCQVLAGLHGAGLTHMLWARPDAAVVEIRGAQESHNNCYYSLASDLGYDYYYVPAKQRSRFRPSFLSDFAVDVERFESTLQQIVGKPNGGVADSANPLAGDSMSR